MNKESLIFYGKAAFYGALLKNLILPLEHPFDLLKTKLQSESKQQFSLKKYIYSLYQQKNLRSLYAGYSMNCLRITLREFYRWPLYLFLNSRFNQQVSNAYLSKALTGMSIALIDVMILCPVERIKVLYEVRLFLWLNRVFNRLI